jgi:SRSO17 transposase
MEVHSDQRVYEQIPQIKIPEDKGGKGRKPSAYKCEHQSVEVRSMVSAIADDQWEQIDIRQGTKGMIGVKDMYARYIYTWEKGASSGCQRLLVIRKTQTKNGEEIKYALSNAGEEEYSTTELVQMQSQRYFIERSFQDAKQEVGMSQYQVIPSILSCNDH